MKMNIINWDVFTLDAKHATLYNDETEEKKMLTVREAKILQLFCKNINETVERKAILSRFWDTEDDYFKSRSLDVFITKLRKLLKDEPRIEIEKYPRSRLYIVTDLKK